MFKDILTIYGKNKGRCLFEKKKEDYIVTWIVYFLLQQWFKFNIMYR